MTTNESLKKFNFKRKLWHMFGLLIPFLLYIDIFRFINPKDEHITRFVGFYMLLIFFIFLLIIEIIRLNYPTFNTFFIQKVGFLMKKTEYQQVHGSVSYVFANIILFYFFTKEVIFLSSLVLMISDPIAAYFGIFFGKHKLFNQKTLEGFLGFFLSSFGVAILFLSFISFLGIKTEYNLYSPNLFSILGILAISSLITSLVELFSFTTLYGFIDDNLTIPLTFAICFAYLSYTFGFSLESYLSPLNLIG